MDVERGMDKLATVDIGVNCCTFRCFRTLYDDRVRNDPHAQRPVVCAEYHWLT